MTSRPIQRLCRLSKAPYLRLPPTLATVRSGGPNLEVFKFGMYIMFPIAWMWYFGTNLETRFTVPDFWPEEGTTHKIPFEKEELKEMSERLKADRLDRRRRRLEQARTEMREVGTEQPQQVDDRIEKAKQKKKMESTGTFGVGAIERWAHGG